MLYSDDRRSEKTVGLYPNGPFYFRPSQHFYNKEQGVVKGFEIQGKLDLKKLQHSCPGRLAVPRWVCGQSVSPWNTMAQMSPAVS